MAMRHNCNANQIITFDEKNDKNVLIAQACYLRLFELMKLIIFKKKYLDNKFYQNLSSSIIEYLQQSVRHMIKVCAVFFNFAEKFKNTTLMQSVDNFVGTNYHNVLTDKKYKYLFSGWYHKYNTNTSVLLSKHSNQPSIDILLNTLITRLSDVITMNEKLPTRTKRWTLSIYRNNDPGNQDNVNAAIRKLQNACDHFKFVLKCLYRHHYENCNEEYVCKFVNSSYNIPDIIEISSESDKSFDETVSYESNDSDEDFIYVLFYLHGEKLLKKNIVMKSSMADVLLSGKCKLTTQLVLVYRNNQIIFERIVLVKSTLEKITNSVVGQYSYSMMYYAYLFEDKLTITRILIESTMLQEIQSIRPNIYGLAMSDITIDGNIQKNILVHMETYLKLSK